MRTILAAFLILLLLIPVSAIGEIQTITHTIKQPFGGSQSPDDARIAAVAKAKREALEMAGTYIESLTVVKNSQVDKDEILALAAGVLKAEVVSQKNYIIGDAFGIEIVVNVVVDTSVLEERVKKLLQDRIYLGQLNQARTREKELLEKIAVLEEKNRENGKSNKKKANLKKEFQNASRGLTAVDWTNKAFALWIDGKFIDPKKVIEYLTNSIRLEPNAPNSYHNRGFAYHEDGQYQRAIGDFNKAIRLKPDLAPVYVSRGVAYYELGQYQRAIEDFNEAIRLKPDDDVAYYNRGLTYGKNLGQYQRAFEDLDEAISLKPDDASAYNNRGIVYCMLGQYQRAIEDYNEAIRLRPDNAGTYSIRGVAYNELGQYQRAIEDFNEAIRLKPTDAGSYINRGLAYLIESKNYLGCRDLQKACELGDCRGYELTKDKGFCR